MERPNHLNVGDKSATSKAGSIAIVAGIHIAVIFGLVAALNQGALMKQLQEIKATVDAKKEPPKAPPPPPPDLVKPPPPVAIVPVFQVASAPPPPVRTEAPKPPPPPAPTHAVSNDPLRAIGRTHSQPPYPPISIRLNESGNTLVEVNIGVDGNVTECHIVKGSGSERLDGAACDWIKSHWRWQPPTLNGVVTPAKSQINVTWNLKDAK